MDGYTQSLGGMKAPGPLVVVRIPSVNVPVCVLTSVAKCVLRRTHRVSEMACVSERLCVKQTACVSEMASVREKVCVKETPCVDETPCVRKTVCVRERYERDYDWYAGRRNRIPE